jgi:hypothetical protein
MGHPPGGHREAPLGPKRSLNVGAGNLIAGTPCMGVQSPAMTRESRSRHIP